MTFTSAIRNKLDNSTLHGNSIFLMLAQAIVTVFGYIFWIVVAHLYKTTAVGLAGTLIATATLISQVSILGLNNAIVRFLPHSKDKNEKINTSLWLVTVASILIALCYIVLIPIASPKLLFIRHDPLLLTLFVVSMILVTINTFTDSVFLVNHATKYNTIIYGAYSIIRLILPFAFVRFGTLGIFGAHIAGVALAVILSFYYMVKKLNYRFSTAFNFGIVRQIGGYSLGSYIAGFLWVLPLLIAPTLIVNELGVKPAAYFYMANTIVNCLLIIPLATTQALFAEGSHATTSLYHLVVKSLRVTMSLVTLGVLGLLLLGKLVILVFGREYANGGTNLLYLLTLTTLIVAINMTANAVLKIRRQTWALVFVNLAGATGTVIASKLLMRHYGLLGIGMAYALGHLIMLSIFGGMFGVEILKRTRYTIARPRTATE